MKHLYIFLSSFSFEKVFPGEEKITLRDDIIKRNIHLLIRTYKKLLCRPPPVKLLPVLEIIKSAYIIWQSYVTISPKTSRYTLGETIDKYFIQTIESILVASFLEKQEKQPFVRKAIISLDTLKFLLYILWEVKAIETKKYIALSEPLAEAGKQLGGWHGQIVKQNSPTKVGEK
ncbi:MAG TPA: four helix bundle protein [Candidatus Paceibacterota bacterium]